MELLRAAYSSHTGVRPRQEPRSECTDNRPSLRSGASVNTQIGSETKRRAWADWD